MSVALQPHKTLDTLPSCILSEIGRLVDCPLAYLRTSKTISKQAGGMLVRRDKDVSELLQYHGIAKQIQSGVFGVHWQETIKELNLQYVFRVYGENASEYNDRLLQIIVIIFPNLQKLVLRGGIFTDKSIRLLSNLSSLTDLDIHGTYWENTKKCARAVSKIKRAKDLKGTFKEATSSCYTTARVQMLRRYIRKGCEFVYIPRSVPSYHEMFQWSTHFKLLDIEKEGISFLQNMPLRELIVVDTELEDENLEILAKIQTLQKINLSSCDLITNSGLSYLVRLPDLKELIIHEDCKNKLSIWTAIRIKALRHYLPEVARRTYDIFLSTIKEFLCSVFEGFLLIGCCVLLPCMCIGFYGLTLINKIVEVCLKRFPKK